MGQYLSVPVTGAQSEHAGGGRPPCAVNASGAVNACARGVLSCCDALSSCQKERVCVTLLCVPSFRCVTERGETRREGER